MRESSQISFHFQGKLTRQVSFYTVLSGFLLPWPPSCCLKQSTPFIIVELYVSSTNWRCNPRRQFCLPKQSPLPRKTVYHSKFENCPAYRRQVSLIDDFTYRSFLLRCYPEGNFGWNQLLGSSMSLSPLFLDVTKDLHVTTAESFQENFFSLH